MRTQMLARLVFAALVVTTVAANAANNKPHSTTLVVESPSDSPALAQANSEAMYLYMDRDGRTLLYVESAEGTKLTALDVSDPAKIQRLGETQLVASGAFDFVEPVGNNSALIRYRDGSGEAVLSFKNCKHPVLGSASAALTSTEGAEKLGKGGLLSTAGNTAGSIIASSDPTYKVWDTSKGSDPTLLTTIPGVTQRLSNEDTGTLFLLTRDGITMIRRPRVEQEHKIELMDEDYT